MSYCNGCDLEYMKEKYGDKLIKVGDTWYLKGEEPLEGQSEPLKLQDGTPIQFLVWFMGEGHACGRMENYCTYCGKWHRPKEHEKDSADPLNKLEGLEDTA